VNKFLIKLKGVANAAPFFVIVYAATFYCALLSLSYRSVTIMSRSMHVVIIGNGISGTTTARHLRKLDPDVRITVISAETDYFFSRTALMYIYMGHMGYDQTKPYEDSFWPKNRIDLMRAFVRSIDFNAKTLFLKTTNKKSAHGSPPSELSYDKLVLALGSASNKFGWPGQDLKGVGGLYHFQDLENMEAYTAGLQRAVIVGGGLIGIEMAEMFHSRHIPVTMLVREPSYWNNVLPSEESAMINNHIVEHGIDLRLGEELSEILSEDGITSNAVRTKNTAETIPCGYVGLTAGVHPNVHWLKDSDLEIARGIVVNEYLQSNIEDVYAVGDCAHIAAPQPGRRNVEAIWYTGRMMGEVAAYNILGRHITYDPGIWFNSAKFLDIEYQVYGNVPARLPEDLSTLYWEHADGKKSVRINYNKEHNTVEGFNLMGIRYRHEVCEKWILQKTNMVDVLSNLELAEFDPEFYASYASELRKIYTKQTGQSVQQKSSRSWNKVFSFLTN